MFNTMTKFNVLPLKVNLLLEADWTVGPVVGSIPASYLGVIYRYIFNYRCAFYKHIFYEEICILISRSIHSYLKHVS